MALPKLLVVVLLLTAQSEVIRHSLLSDRFSFSLPSSFKEDSGPRIKNDLAGFTDRSRMIGVNFGLYPDEIDPKEFRAIAAEFAEMRKKSPSVREWFGTDFIEINGRTYCIMTMRTENEGIAMVHRAVLSMFDNRILMMNVSAKPERLEEIKQIATDMLHSIEIK